MLILCDLGMLYLLYSEDSNSLKPCSPKSKHITTLFPKFLFFRRLKALKKTSMVLRWICAAESRYIKPLPFTQSPLSAFGTISTFFGIKNKGF